MVIPQDNATMVRRLSDVAVLCRLNVDLIILFTLQKYGLVRNLKETVV